MRLIDADALIRELCGDCIGLMQDGECRFGKQCDDIPFIRNAPTISPKTGRWIEDSGNIACSECHTIWLHRRTDYCPNCGCRMEEVTE